MGEAYSTARFCLDCVRQAIFEAVAHAVFWITLYCLVLLLSNLKTAGKQNAVRRFGLFIVKRDGESPFHT